MTSSIKVVNYSPGHLEAIDLKDVYGDWKPSDIRPPAYTFLYKDKPLAILGGFILAPGVMQCWALVSPLAYKVPLAFVKSVKTILKYATEELKVRRFQFSVVTGFTEGWKFAEVLGFKCEGTMKAYNVDGSDCWLFGRTA